MGLPRKGSRSIVVDGRRDRWGGVDVKVTWCSASCPLRLVVQREDGRGAILTATFRSRERDEAGREWLIPRYGANLTPAKVADIIRAGLAAGWNPDAAGRPPATIDGDPFLRLPDQPPSDLEWNPREAESQ